MLRIVVVLAGLLSLPSLADFNCEVDLQQGLLVNDTQIRVLHHGLTLYQINHDQQLIVQGQWIELNPEQSQLLQELSSGIRYSVPKMILLATEGVDLAIATIEHVYLGLVGEEHASYKRLQSALERAKDKVRMKFIHAGDQFFIGPRSLENVDELVDSALEEEIEHAINTSIGGILSAIGGLATDGDVSFEKRMENLSQKLETMGAEIERQVGPQAQTLRKKAVWFCEKIKRLDIIEEKLKQQVPALQPYDVIVTGGTYKHEKH
ncbi:YggN family protein [Alteromonadaceae bacterium BrNp21-10]|nr:YggN family protein [Alteromonadaceae bacterium BrNp21-10]